MTEETDIFRPYNIRISALEGDLKACKLEHGRLTRKLKAMERTVDLSVLHPVARDAFIELAADLEQQFESGRVAHKFVVFESYRSPVRQNELYNQTNPRVTQVRAWGSSHQFGLAVDFVGLDEKGLYSWAESNNWDFLKKRAEVFGLRVPIAWDRGHVEHPFWRKLKAVE